MSRVARWVALVVTLLGGSTPAFAEGHGRARAKLSGVVNLNQGPVEVLELLPGVGPVRAEQIVEYRTKHPFKKVDELAKIKGIGRKTMARLRPFVAVAGATTLSDGKEDAAAPEDKLFDAK